MNKWVPYANERSFSVVSINGGTNQKPDANYTGTEAALDIQYGISLAYNDPVTFYTTGGRGPLIDDLEQPDATVGSEPWLQHLKYLLGLPQDGLPTVLSMSYGEDEQSLPESYTQTVCNMLAQLGARGASILASR